jgi:hypothetical protein
MAKKTYWEKLKDPKWQKKRLEVMQANDFCCEICGDNETTLNVHHKEYFKDHEPWEYKNEQLACLCEDCHESMHDEVDILKVVCSYAKLDGPDNRTELAYLMAGYMGIDYEGMLKFTCHEDDRTIRNYHLAGMEAKEVSNKRIVEDYKNSQEGKDEGLR